MKWKACRSHLTFLYLPVYASVFGVCITIMEGGPSGGSFFGVGEGRGTKILYQALDPDGVVCLDSGFGEQSQHCQDWIGTSIERTQLLLPTLHIFLFRKENS